MLDEENDKSIVEAANQYHPGYDESAWAKMEQMLDEHLPQKKRSRRIVFLLSLLVILCALIFFAIFENVKKQSTLNPADITIAKNNAGKFGLSNSSSSNSTESINTPSLSEASKNHKISKKIENDLPITSLNKVAGNINPGSVLSNDEIISSGKRNNFEENITEGSKPLLNQQPIASGKSNNFNNIELTQDSITNNEITGQTEIKEKNAITANESKQAENIAKKAKITKKGFQNNFGITVSAGPDVSEVHANNTGKLTVAFGAGLSYSISKRFTVRTGFQVSKKIYSVAGEDYHIPTGSLPNYNYLENVGANCKVYEIPIKLDYNFGNVKNHSWFVSAGLSSYLMKKEVYNYYYKTPGGQAYTKNWTVNNKNKHFLSVLDISGGYQYSFNKQFSIIAEPYVEIPLTGIGAGKVKLNSGGILFTLKAKPFLKKR
jgi:hypothetical protein